MKLKAIIVDDEYSAREVLLELVERFCPDIETVALCSNVENAVEKINLHKPDLVFLDVEMPNYAGYEIVEFFDTVDFNIIFITAYDKYAIKAFEVSAVDYLLKPIEIDRFKEAIEKARRNINAKSYKQRLSLLADDLKKSERKYTYSDRGFVNYVNTDEIIAFEAQRAYSTMFLTKSRTVTISKNIKTILKEIEEYDEFHRVHRSWIINKSHLEKYSRATQELFLKDKIVAKIARQNKSIIESFFE